jgi:nucleoside-diphosphate-sugar epimerase
MKFDFNNVYVTGASGWLGRQCIEVLLSPENNKAINFVTNDELNIHAMVLPAEKESSFIEKLDLIRIFDGDIRFENDIKNFFDQMDKSLLIHTAGVIHPNKVNEFYDINLEGTKNVIKNALNMGIQKIIVVSSNSPIGCNKSSNTPFNEESEYQPYMNYGKSKMLMELYLKELISQGHDISIIRPPWFHGENMPERQKSFYSMIIKGHFPIFGKGKNIRSVANVNNIVQGIILCSIKDISKGKIYWISDEKHLTMEEIIRTIENVIRNEYGIDCKKNRIRVPSFFADIFEIFDYLIQKLGLYNQQVHVLSEMNKSIFCDISKAKNELGYKPKIDLYQGTKDALAEFFNE